MSLKPSFFMFDISDIPVLCHGTSECQTTSLVNIPPRTLSETALSSMRYSRAYTLTNDVAKCQQAGLTVRLPSPK